MSLPAGVLVVTVDEAAEHAGVAPTTIRMWVRLGKLPAVRLGKHRSLIPRHSLAGQMPTVEELQRQIEVSARLLPTSVVYSRGGVARARAHWEHDPSELTQAQVAGVLRVSINTVRRATAAGQLRNIRSPKGPFYRSSDLAELLLAAPARRGGSRAVPRRDASRSE